GFSQTHPDLAQAIKRLCSAEPDARLIRNWLKRRRKGKDHPLAYAQPVGYFGEVPLPCEAWEAALFDLAQFFAYNPAVSPWQRAGKDKREAHASRVARLARKLADALEESITPKYPPLLALFDDPDILRMASEMPQQIGLISGKILARPHEPPVRYACRAFRRPVYG
ncbi:MAG TPA: hypothetical protein VLT88_02855, partial [Desulfosarcina sp.]|nr:hypothetical protein [Desulfosarcina sp.]